MIAQLRPDRYGNALRRSQLRRRLSHAAAPLYNSGSRSPNRLLSPPRLCSSMINNLPVKTLKHGDLTIEGYSRAAVQTYWRFPELKLGFDLGAQPWSFMGTETWFVTHGHLDHIVGAAGVRGPAADDEDEAAGDLHAGRDDRADAEDPAAVHAARPRPAAVRAAADRAGRRDRAVARADRVGRRPRGTRCRRWASSCGTAGGS